MFTKEQIDRYVLCAPTFCPACGSPKIEGANLPSTPIDGAIYLTRYCQVCHTTWEEEYTLHFIYEVLST